MREINEDVIRTKAASDAYRDNWERIFGEAPERKPVDEGAIVHGEGDTIECKLTSYVWWCPTCGGYVSNPADHQFHARINLAASRPTCLEIGWPCPCCTDKVIMMIDYEERVFECIPLHAPCNTTSDRMRHSFAQLEDKSYKCQTCCDTGCVVDPNVDPDAVQTEGDLLKDCPDCTAGRDEAAYCWICGTRFDGAERKTCCESCYRHDPACAKLCTEGDECDCGAE